jgi:hypothetical protein
MLRQVWAVYFSLDQVRPSYFRLSQVMLGEANLG